MNLVLEQFDAIVTNVANSYRLQEECDVLSLVLSKHPGEADDASHEKIVRVVVGVGLIVVVVGVVVSRSRSGSSGRSSADKRCSCYLCGYRSTDISKVNSGSIHHEINTVEHLDAPRGRNGCITLLTKSKLQRTPTVPLPTPGP